MTTLTLRDLGFVGGLGGLASGYNPTHPETASWLSRVIANGGSVSDATLQALDTFCAAIDAQSGLRGQITRLNLFCGNQLAAALVPQYLAESAGATAKGNSTDVNSGATPFSSGSYASTGPSGGLTGNGIAYLNTGLTNSNCATPTSGHLSFSATGITESVKAIMGTTKDNVASNVDDILVNVNVGGTFGIVDIHRRASFSSDTVNTSPKTSYQHWISTQTSSTSRVLYSAGTAIMTSTSTPLSLTLNSTHPYYVFATNTDNGAGAAPTSWRLRQYSIGGGLTAAQAAAFSAAVIAFYSALGR
ncbi:MAG: hypothetical protein ACK6AD_02405 [Cyanobacteriota bacterium]|jgi:hypothetical protein